MCDHREQILRAELAGLLSRKLAIYLALLLGPARLVFAASPIEVDVAFENGSATVLAIDSQAHSVRLSPGGDPNRGWACWWYARINNVMPGKTLHLELVPSALPTRNSGKLTDKPLAAAWSTPDQAWYSHDGENWQRTEPGRRSQVGMEYLIPCKNSSIWVAWGPPFTPQDAERLINNAVAKIPTARRFELAKTRQGHSVPGLLLTSENRTDAPRVWIQSRQHAWESGSSWVARGLVEWLSSHDEPARWLVEHAQVVVVPIMDVDNVATGNGGKEADPSDHNRDWSEMPHYPEVKAAQDRLLSWAADGRLDFFIDLHNPAPGDRRPFFFCGPPELLSEVGRKNRALFLELAAGNINGPLAVDPTPRVTGPNYHPLWSRISGQWVTKHGNSHTVALCLETAWNSPHSTLDGYLAVGKQLGAAVSQYLQRRN